MSKKLVVWIVIVCALISDSPALAEPAEAKTYAANPNADPMFGLGVAVRAGAGKTDINQNDQDALSLIGLNANAKTWSVYQLESNSDVNHLLSSYDNYPPYGNAFYDEDMNDIPEGYTGSNWNLISSSESGTPGVGTFIVTHIVLKDLGGTDYCLNSLEDYCIYGLSGQPDVWGQDSAQPGGKYLDAPTNFCSIMPKAWRRYFKQPVPAPSCPDGENGDPAYNPVGMISVMAKDIWAYYPNYGTGTNIIHDIRVPLNYWQSITYDNTTYYESGGGISSTGVFTTLNLMMA